MMRNPGHHWSKSVFVIACLACASVRLNAQSGEEPIAVGVATLIDVSHFGTSQQDVQDATVLIRDGKIEAVGPTGDVTIQKGYTVLDATGLFLVPGLIDGFGAMRTEGYAKAYLSEGVTTVYIRRLPTVRMERSA